MALNNAQKDIINHRRRQVATLRLRGLDIRAIVRALAAQGHTNPDTREPWGVTTIHNDVKALESQWMKDACADIAQHKGRVLAELEEVRRTAWRNSDLDKVLKALTQVRALMGLDQPVKVAPTNPEGDREYDPPSHGLDDHQLVERALELLERGRARGTGIDPEDGGL